MALAATARAVSKSEIPEDQYSKQERQVSKFFSTPKWKTDSERLFRLWNKPVYVVPIISPINHPTPSRIAFLTWQQALPLLKRTDFDLNNLKSELDSGAIIFLSEASGLEKNFFPSTWNMIHAVFDQAPSSSAMRDVWSKTFGVVDDFIYEQIKSSGIPNFNSIFTKALMVSITSKSGRDGLFTTPDAVGDMIAEILTQAALTTKGCVLKHYENDKLPQESVDEINRILKELQDLVNGMNVRGELEDAFSGKIISVKTYVNDQ